MPKKATKSRASGAVDNNSTLTLGQFLAKTRTAKQMTLRQVEDATDKEISNGYLSQLENDKITKPSPHVLHTLAGVYDVAYDELMRKAGYIATRSPESSTKQSSKPGKPQQHGRAATFAEEALTKREEDQLLEYLAFLRSRK